MEKLVISKEFKNAIIEYRDDNRLTPYECGIINELLTAFEKNDAGQLNWFNQFGDDLRGILLNVHSYRKGQEFGFTEIVFDKYQWLRRPEFLDKEDLTFGSTERYWDHSIVHLGRGINGICTYALNYSFGLAGGGGSLSVFGKQFKNRESALVAGINDLKNMMTAKLGNKDTSNYKQPIILATLRDITKMEISMVQLSLF